MESEFAKLREHAQAAYDYDPRPWRADVMGSEGYMVRSDNLDKPVTEAGLPKRIAYCGHHEWDFDRLNALHIASADPRTVLRLLNLLEHKQQNISSLRAENATLRAYINEKELDQ